jgi:fumarate hydratase class I
MTVIIREADLIESVADALQYISYYHPMDYIRALGAAYEKEESPAAKDAIAQILTNSRMCAEGHRPICQDTGIVTVFVEWGQQCMLDSDRSLQEVVDEGVRRAYLHPENRLRASIVADPAFSRKNTRDNTPSVLHVAQDGRGMVPARHARHRHRRHRRAGDEARQKVAHGPDRHGRTPRERAAGRHGEVADRAA